MSAADGDAELLGTGLVVDMFSCDTLNQMLLFPALLRGTFTERRDPDDPLSRGGIIDFTHYFFVGTQCADEYFEAWRRIAHVTQPEGLVLMLVTSMGTKTQIGDAVAAHYELGMPQDMAIALRQLINVVAEYLPMLSMTRENAMEHAVDIVTVMTDILLRRDAAGAAQLVADLRRVRNTCRSTKETNKLLAVEGIERDDDDDASVASSTYAGSPMCEDASTTEEDVLAALVDAQ